MNKELIDKKPVPEYEHLKRAEQAPKTISTCTKYSKLSRVKDKKITPLNDITNSILLLPNKIYEYK